VELGIPAFHLESMESFIPEPDRWPISDTWPITTGIRAAAERWPSWAHGDRIRSPSSLEDFERKAQMLDYAGHRAIFEALPRTCGSPTPALDLDDTAGWPSMEWNFLSPDYDTQSSFYGTQKACEPVHAQLDLTDAPWT